MGWSTGAFIRQYKQFEISSRLHRGIFPADLQRINPSQPHKLVTPTLGIPKAHQPALSASIIASSTTQLENLAGIFFLHTHTPSISTTTTKPTNILIEFGILVETDLDLPSDLLNPFSNKVGNFLIHRTVLARVREALSSEFLLDGVETFVHVVAIVCDAGASGIRCGGGVHGEGEEGFGIDEIGVGDGVEGMFILLSVGW